MTPVDFAAIESRLEEAFGPWWREVDVRASASDVRALLVAVRERDNTIARVQAVLDDYDGLDAEPIPKLSTYTWMHEVRAALDPQETP